MTQLFNGVNFGVSLIRSLSTFCSAVSRTGSQGSKFAVATVANATTFCHLLPGCSTGSRAGVNSAPELELIANSNSGIELELPSLELELNWNCHHWNRK